MEENSNKVRSNHTSRGNAIFMDEEVKNEPTKLTILRLEQKKQQMLEKYRQTEYYKNKQNKSR